MHPFDFVSHAFEPEDRQFLNMARFIATAPLGHINCSGKKNIPRLGFPRSTKDEPVHLYVSRHKSEFDYVAILDRLAENGTYALTQAGDNLFIGPLDRLLRRLGAFKVIRFDSDGSRAFYHPDWRVDLARRINRLAGLREYAFSFSRQMSGELYQDYIEHIVSQGYDLLVFPEIVRIGREKKAGRSKSGLLNEFSPAVFNSVIAASQKAGRPLAIIPTNVSYERVPEDRNLANVGRLAKAYGPAIAYAYDFFYNMSMMLPLRKKPRVTVSFGAPIYPEPGKSMVRNAVRAAWMSREEAGRLEVPYPIHALAYSAVHGIITDDWHKRANRLFYGSRRLPGFRAGRKELEHGYLTALEILAESGADCSCLRSGKNLMTLDGVVESSYRMFRGSAFRSEKDSLQITDSRTMLYYANQVYHLLQNASGQTRTADLAVSPR